MRTWRFYVSSHWQVGLNNTLSHLPVSLWFVRFSLREKSLIHLARWSRSRGDKMRSEVMSADCKLFNLLPSFRMVLLRLPFLKWLLCFYPRKIENSTKLPLLLMWRSTSSWLPTPPFDPKFECIPMQSLLRLLHRDKQAQSLMHPWIEFRKKSVPPSTSDGT